MKLSILLFACVSASLDHLSLTAEKMANVAISPFISIDEFKSRFNAARLLERGTLLFLDDVGNDMIELMRDTLQLSTRQEAVDYFIAHNTVELDFAITKTFITSSDPVAAVLMSQAFSVVNSGMIAPIVQLVSEFLNLIRKPCLIDHLPSYFEDASNYAEMFTPLARSAYRVNLRYEDPSVQGVLHDELIQAPYTKIDVTTWNTSVVHIERQSVTEPHLNHTRLVDLRAGCAVDVNPLFRDASLVSQGRIFHAWEKSSDRLFIWRGDEIHKPDTLHHPHQSWISADGASLVFRCFQNANSRLLAIPLAPDSPFPSEHVSFIPGDIHRKSPRMFSPGLLNGSVEELILLKKAEEDDLLRAFYAVRHRTRRDVLNSGTQETRSFASHIHAGRLLSAWRVLRTITGDEMAQLSRY